MEVSPLMSRNEPASAAIRGIVRDQERQQTAVATAVGLSWPQWQRRISGKVPWRRSELSAIADELGVSLDRLTGAK
jgi:hypothetical protein